MKTSRLDFDLPPGLIAQHPVTPRDAARLMIVDRKSKKIIDSHFMDIGDFLLPGDVLVFNQSKVFAARTYATTQSGKKLEIFFLEEIEKNIWDVLVGGRSRDGESLDFGYGFKGTIEKGPMITLRVTKNKAEVLEFLEEHGEVPLPPYIKRSANNKDKQEYQNIFAREVGSAAAPTAGMHFTRRLLKKIEKKGVQIEFVTLHVGLGTFAPIKTEKVEDHVIHREKYFIEADARARIMEAKREGRRIIACGTTSLRVLESLNDNATGSDSTEIFIHPGYKFRLVDGLITNFHTPKSSLLALVWAFGTEGLMKKSYRLAIKKQYRFFSYGDGMFIF